MASRSRTTFKKRQKELARMEKQRDKAAKRMQRKAEKLSGGISDDGTQELDDELGLGGEDAGESGEASEANHAGEAAGLPDPRGSGS
jgi:hypothetical protein